MPPASRWHRPNESGPPCPACPGFGRWRRCRGWLWASRPAAWARPSAGAVVLRPYRRGGLVRHVNSAIYWSPARFQREFQVHRALWAAGLPTVEPLGWACRRRLWGWEGVYLSRFAYAAPWPRAWDRAVPAQLRVLLDALCAWGLYAPDLNATNVLVDPSGAILTLDWDRAWWTPEAGLMQRYRERLIRSLRKLGAPSAIVEAF